VLTIRGWPEPGLALHPFRDRPAPTARFLAEPTGLLPDEQR
jgi:hypothetical protein